MAKLDERYTRDIAAENYERIIANLESEVERLRAAIGEAEYILSTMSDPESYRAFNILRTATEGEK